MSLPVRLRKKPRHIFKCTSVEQYSSLLGIHKESILVRLSTSSWIMHLGLALSALFRGSNDLSSSEQLCPGRLPHEWYFSEGLRITRAAHVLSCHHAVLVFICRTLLMRQTFWQRAVTVADVCCYDMKTVKVLKSHLSSFFFFALGEEATDKTLLLWHWSHQRARTFIFMLCTGCMWADLKWSRGACMWFYCLLMQRRRVKRWWQITPYIN